MQPLELMEPIRPWWQGDGASVPPLELRERMAWACYVIVPFLIGSFLFRVLGGFGYVASLLAMAPIAALGCFPVLARLRRLRAKHERPQ